MRIGVVGGGVVGSAIATWLIGDGHRVTLFERDLAARHASAGNAGLLALPEIEPLARPGIIRQAPGWLLDPLGPLALRPLDAPALAPWMLAFLAASTPARVRASTEALALLMRTALADHVELGRRAGLNEHFRKTGGINVYDRPAGVEAGLAHARPMIELLGYAAERLTPAQVRELIPALTGPVAGGVLLPDYHTVTDPWSILQGLRARIMATGAIVPLGITAVQPGEAGVSLVDDNGTIQLFDAVVVASGVWSRELVRDLGLKVLLETERGYNTTYAQSPIELPIPVTFADHGFIASPLGNQLRVGGAVELAAVDAPPNMKRARAMREKMRRYFPTLPDEGGVEWMGRRPSTPDSLPVISRHPDDRRILFAFGHGHLGLTLSAVTARRIAAFVAGDAAAEMRPFAIDRFQ